MESKRVGGCMKKCQGCEAMIDDKYAACFACVSKAKSANAQGDLVVVLREISKHLEHVVWNTGRMVSVMEGDKELGVRIKKAQGGTI